MQSVSFFKQLKDGTTNVQQSKHKTPLWDTGAKRQGNLLFNALLLETVFHRLFCASLILGKQSA